MGGKLVVNAWVDHSIITPQPTGSINLVRGVNYTIEYDYYEKTETAFAELFWSNACQAKVIVPHSQLFYP